MNKLTYDNFLINNLINTNNVLVKEGLIYSTSYSIFIDKLSKILDKYNLKYNFIKSPDSVKVELKVKKDKKLYDDIYSLLNLSGYYISLWYDDDNKEHKSDISIFSFMNNQQLIIYFNKKFDFEDNGIKIFMYHVSTLDNKNSILVKGLIQKSKNKIDNHPDRIYLFDTLEDAILFSNDIIEPIIFKIDMRVVGKIKLYSDPKYPNFDAFYTYDNISKLALKEITL